VNVVKRNSSIGFIHPNAHLYIFRPSAEYGNYSGYGFHLRCRRSGSWRHLLARLHCKHKLNRQARSYELCTWRSREATSSRGSRPGQRIGFKSYVRLKVSPGGASSPSNSRALEGKQ
jgi:hypothetical protein